MSIFSTVTFYILLPWLIAFLIILFKVLFKKKPLFNLQLIDQLTLPVLIATLAISHFINFKTPWLIVLSLSLWGIIWALTRYYYDRELYYRRFFKSWWRFVFLMCSVWYILFSFLYFI